MFDVLDYGSLGFGFASCVAYLVVVLIAITEADIIVRMGIWVSLVMWMYVLFTGLFI